MIMTLNIVNESSSDFTYHGESHYLLSQGKTIESANNNVLRYCKQYWDFFEYELNLKEDVLPFLLNRFSEHCNNGDDWREDFNFTFPKSNQAKVVEISEEMFNRIMDSDTRDFLVEEDMEY